MAELPARAALEQDDRAQRAASSPPKRGLLPSPVANLVSLGTRSTSFALRLGTGIGGYFLGFAKFTTLSSLELGRGIVEGILSHAGNDVISQSRSELGRENAETILEKSLESIHYAMVHMVFWASTGFHITESTVSSVSEISQIFLTLLDQFFGSTDSSRAIASIITLIRREFQNPATGVQGEKVGVVDLILGLCGLAYLQNHCRRALQEEGSRLGYEEVIWDVVVLNDGARVDVGGNELVGARQSEGPTGDNGMLGAIERHGLGDHSLDDDLPEAQLKRQIMEALPKDACVSISSSTTTTKIITVEVRGSREVPLLTPPGADLIETEILSPDDQSSAAQNSTPTYRAVYRISQNRRRSISLQRDDDDDTQSRIEVIDDDEEEEEEEVVAKPESPERGPPVPPKSPAPATASKTAPTGSRPSSSRVPHVSLSRKSSEAANQKRTRQPLGVSNSTHNSSSTVKASSKPAASRRDTADSGASTEKKGGFRSVLGKKPPSLASLLNKDSSSEDVPNKSRPATRTLRGGAKGKVSLARAPAAVPDRSASLATSRETGRPSQRGGSNFLSRDRAGLDADSRLRASPSRSSYLAVQRHRRSSTVSQTDTLSIHSVESRPGSPTVYRSHHRSTSRAGNEIVDSASHSPPKHNQRPRSQLGLYYSPSVYTLHTNISQGSLVLANYQQKSAYSESEAIDTLKRTGMVDGMFPNFHILRNITRYSRYASAAYGSQFMKLMGISKEESAPKASEDAHHDVRSFARHTELPPDSILLSSFIDHQGGSDSTGSTDTGVPLVHTISVDQESKAVVLSCRGTLGFDDVLADMMCEYDDLMWRGQAYQVHKGVHASARRLLYGGDGRVLYTLKEALEEFSGYGLILCGHSLGGAVAALLGAMLAEPAATGSSFVTSAQEHSRLLMNEPSSSGDSAPISLPAGRPIHVYAYGPPGTMSPSLQKATRGLITTTVHGNDLVPYLSLGTLHDFQALALAFKSDNSEAKAEVRHRIWGGLQSGLADKWYNNGRKMSAEEEDQWAYAALKTLRVSMLSRKLLPPGEVFTVERTAVLRREAFTGEGQIGRSATRIVLKYVRDVEARFREVRFGASMLLDHSPGRYEDVLRRLAVGVM